MPVPIGVAEDERGLLVSLPRQFWLVVGLRALFPRVQAAAEPWTYRVPPCRGAARRIEAWIAEVELEARARARRRSWSASDAEWLGAGEPEPPVPVASAPPVIVLPRKRTAKKVLALLDTLSGNAILSVRVEGGKLTYRLSPSGRKVRRAVAARAIRMGFLLPGLDGLFGPEWSQTWRAPTQGEIAAAALKPTRPRKVRAAPSRGPRSSAPTVGPSRETRP